MLGAAYFDKKNTPTMGGLIIFLSVFGSSVLWAAPNIWVIVSLFVYAALTVPGFRDDYLKVLRRNRDGIAPWEKIAWQSGATLVALTLLLWHPLSAAKIRELWVPFVKHAVIPVMPWWLLLALLYGWVVGFSNAINLTDGLDGLAVGCTITVAIVFAIMAYLADHVFLSEYLLISHVPGTGELSVICGALIGGGMAFLWFNSHPAEVFMGDTGSLALGGLIGVMAFMIHQPLTLVIAGGEREHGVEFLGGVHGVSGVSGWRGSRARSRGRGSRTGARPWSRASRASGNGGGPVPCGTGGGPRRNGAG
jgi:phospho-N-acetylmuramoyl-pentapeptide-transferase